MKKKEIQELRTKEPKELEAMAAKKRVELDSALIDMRAGRTKDVHTARKLRHDIARMLTVMRDKKLATTDYPDSKRITWNSVKSNEKSV